MTKRLFVLINLVLITFTVYFGVDILYKFLGRRLAANPSAAQTAHPIPRDSAIRNRHAQPLRSYQAIVGRNLFGTQAQAEAKTEEAAAVDVAALQPTQLKLRLWGTVTGDPETDYAVIEDSQTREQNLYRPGDPIQTATVKMVLREKVVLTVGGKDEVLEMEEERSNSPSRIPQRVLRRAPTPRPQNITLNRSLIEDAVSDVSRIMTQVKIRPYLQNGKPIGLLLTDIKPGSIFNRMGLGNGDIITGVDGREIQTVDDALKLYENLRSSSNLTVQIKRRGLPKTISYNIR